MILLFKTLYIFDSTEEKARVVNFDEGVNIITSSEKAGNKVGKSTILKSLYHALGGDCTFEDSWDANTKILIVKFLINDKEYYVLRKKNLFKIFSVKNMQLLHASEGARSDLGKFLSKLFQFKLMLQNRENKFVLASPVFSYLLNFWDQDKATACEFRSFNNTTQFSNFRENVIYAHLGVYSEDYYNLEEDKFCLQNDRKVLNHQHEIYKVILESLNEELNGLNYSTDTEELEREVKIREREYKNIIKELSNIKDNLIQLKDKEYDLTSAIKNLEKEERLLEKSLNITPSQCPQCDSKIDSIETRVKLNGTLENYYELSLSLQEKREELGKEIEKKQRKYKENLSQYEKYQQTIQKYSQNIDNVLRHQGLNSYRNSIMLKKAGEMQKLENIDDQLKKITKELKSYADLKKEVNSDYFSLMRKTKKELNLQIDDNKIEKINQKFTVDGSAAQLATLAWFSTLWSLKKKYNQDAITFPLVLDGIANAEMDENSKDLLFSFLLKKIPKSGQQVIISKLGTLESTTHALNIIDLGRQGSRLLNEDDYIKNENLLRLLTNINE